MRICVRRTLIFSRARPCVNSIRQRRLIVVSAQSQIVAISASVHPQAAIRLTASLFSGVFLLIPLAPLVSF